MTEPYVIELEPEVKAWAELLARSPTTLGEPHSHSLGEGLRELRFMLDGNAMRVTYWLAHSRRIAWTCARRVHP